MHTYVGRSNYKSNILKYNNNFIKSVFKGFPGAAWSYWHKKGLVTGGLYGTNDGCQPYDIKPCEHHVNGTRGPCEEGGRTPKCHHVCENTAYTKKYKEDLTFGQKV